MYHLNLALFLNPSCTNKWILLTLADSAFSYPSPHPSPLIGSKPKKLSLDKMTAPPLEGSRSNSDSPKQTPPRHTWLSPPSPDDSIAASTGGGSGFLGKRSSKKNRLERTRSAKVPFLGSTEDITSPNTINPERQVRLSPIRLG